MKKEVRRYVMTEAWRMYKIKRRHNVDADFGEAMRIAYRAAKILMNIDFYTSKK